YAWQLHDDGIIDHILNWSTGDDGQTAEEDKQEDDDDEDEDDDDDDEVATARSLASRQSKCDKIVSRLLAVRELEPAQQREGKYYLDPGNTRLVGVILRNKHNVEPDAR